MTTEENLIRQRADDALYENLLRCLEILEPLDTQGSPNTLIDLCEKAMSLINEPVRVRANTSPSRHDLVGILTDAGFKVWTETEETRDAMGIRHNDIFVCFNRKEHK